MGKWTIADLAEGTSPVPVDARFYDPTWRQWFMFLRERFWRRNTKAMLDTGVPPSEFVARQLYDMRLDALTDEAVVQAIREYRHKLRVAQLRERFDFLKVFS